MDDGEGGPKEDGGTNVWGEGAEETGADGTRTEVFADGDDNWVEDGPGEVGGLDS